MSIVARLIRQIRAKLANDPRFSAQVFSDYKYVYGKERSCHKLAVTLIEEAARELREVADVTGNAVLNRGATPRWKPDIVAREVNGNPLCVIEYESLNSSDVRIIEKDIAGYQSWKQPNHALVPLLIITTLPGRRSPWYQLNWTASWAYNWAHKGNDDEVRRNPLRYWYRYYRDNIPKRAQRLPISFANLDGNKLKGVNLWDRS